MLMHCTMDELLAIRDGQGSQAALRHLDECDECCDELELLHPGTAGPWCGTRCWRSAGVRGDGVEGG